MRFPEKQIKLCQLESTNKGLGLLKMRYLTHLAMDEIMPEY